MTPLDGASTHMIFMMVFHVDGIYCISFIVWIRASVHTTHGRKPKQQQPQQNKEMNIYESTEKSLELMYLFNPPKTS